MEVWITERQAPLGETGAPVWYSSAHSNERHQVSGWSEAQGTAPPRPPSFIFTFVSNQSAPRLPLTPRTPTHIAREEPAVDSRRL